MSAFKNRTRCWRAPIPRSSHQHRVLRLEKSKPLDKYKMGSTRQATPRIRHGCI